MEYRQQQKEDKKCVVNRPQPDLKCSSKGDSLVSISAKFCLVGHTQRIIITKVQAIGDNLHWPVINTLVLLISQSMVRTGS